MDDLTKQTIINLFNGDTDKANAFIRTLSSHQNAAVAFNFPQKSKLVNLPEEAAKQAKLLLTHADKLDLKSTRPSDFWERVETISSGEPVPLELVYRIANQKRNLDFVKSELLELTKSKSTVTDKHRLFDWLSYGGTDSVVWANDYVNGELDKDNKGVYMSDYKDVEAVLNIDGAEVNEADEDTEAQSQETTAQVEESEPVADVVVDADESTEQESAPEVGVNDLAVVIGDIVKAIQTLDTRYNERFEQLEKSAVSKRADVDLTQSVAQLIALTTGASGSPNLKGAEVSDVTKEVGSLAKEKTETKSAGEQPHFLQSAISQLLK